MKPISPDEVVEQKAAQLPDFVFVAVNELIAQTWHGGSAQFMQDALVEKILFYAPEVATREDIFSKHYLDIEDIYRQVGWIVEYDRPAYYENFVPRFTFRKNKK